MSSRGWRSAEREPALSEANVDPAVARNAFSNGVTGLAAAGSLAVCAARDDSVRDNARFQEPIAIAQLTVRKSGITKPRRP